jgi:hypothetical protein
MEGTCLVAASRSMEVEVAVEVSTCLIRSRYLLHISATKFLLLAFQEAIPTFVPI